MHVQSQKSLKKGYSYFKMYFSFHCKQPEGVHSLVTSRYNQKFAPSILLEKCTVEILEEKLILLFLD